MLNNDFIVIKILLIGIHILLSIYGILIGLFIYLMISNLLGILIGLILLIGIIINIRIIYIEVIKKRDRDKFIGI